MHAFSTDERSWVLESAYLAHVRGLSLVPMNTSEKHLSKYLPLVFRMSKISYLEYVPFLRCALERDIRLCTPEQLVLLLRSTDERS